MPQPTSSLLWSGFHSYVIPSFICQQNVEFTVGNYLAGHAKKTLRVPKTASVTPDLYRVFVKLPIELKLVVRQLLVTLVIITNTYRV